MVFGCSLVHPWFLLGLLPEGDEKGTKEQNLKNRAIFPFLISWSSLGVLSEFSRWNEARYKREEILRIVHF